MHDILFWSILLEVGQGRAYVDFDTFGHTFADPQVVLTTHILLDVGSKVVTCHTDRAVLYDTAQ